MYHGSKLTHHKQTNTLFRMMIYGNAENGSMGNSVQPDGPILYMVSWSGMRIEYIGVCFIIRTECSTYSDII